MPFKRYLIFLAILHIIILSAIGLTMGYFATVFQWSLGTIFGAGIFFFALDVLYLLGDVYQKKTGSTWMKWVGSIALGTTSIGVPIACAGYISLFLPIPTREVGIFLAGLWGAITLTSIYFGTQLPRMKRLNLPLQNTTPLHIIHLTDIHLNGLNTYKKIKKWVTKVNALKPDVIVFTGDLIDIPEVLLEKELYALSQLKATYAKLAVSGNHDFYTPEWVYPDVLKKIGFQYLDNHSVTINEVTFIGLPDKDGTRHGIARKSVHDLLPKNPSGPVVLLDHRPDTFEQSAEAGIQLQLSGHTHWGQIPPFGMLVKWRYSHGVGLGRHREAIIYTAKGTSVWGPPMRLCGYSEVVSIWVGGK